MLKIHPQSSITPRQNLNVQSDYKVRHDRPVPSVLISHHACPSAPPLQGLGQAPKASHSVLQWSLLLVLLLSHFSLLRSLHAWCLPIIAISLETSDQPIYSIRIFCIFIIYVLCINLFISCGTCSPECRKCSINS